MVAEIVSNHACADFSMVTVTLRAVDEFTVFINSCYFTDIGKQRSDGGSVLVDLFVFEIWELEKLLAVGHDTHAMIVAETIAATGFKGVVERFFVLFDEVLFELGSHIFRR